MRHGYIIIDIRVTGDSYYDVQSLRILKMASRKTRRCKYKCGMYLVYKFTSSIVLEKKIYVRINRVIIKPKNEDSRSLMYRFVVDKGMKILKEYLLLE